MGPSDVPAQAHLRETVDLRDATVLRLPGEIEEAFELRYRGNSPFTIELASDCGVFEER